MSSAAPGDETRTTHPLPAERNRVYRLRARCSSFTVVRSANYESAPALALYGVTPWLYLPVYAAVGFAFRARKLGVAGVEHRVGDGPCRDDLARHQATRSTQRRGEELTPTPCVLGESATSATPTCRGSSKKSARTIPTSQCFKRSHARSRTKLSAIPPLPATRIASVSADSDTVMFSRLPFESSEILVRDRRGRWLAPACRRPSARSRSSPCTPSRPSTTRRSGGGVRCSMPSTTSHEQRTTPLLLIGDFNATMYHPRFDDLLDTGLTDAHSARGTGLTGTWPRDRAVPTVPAHRPRVELEGARPGQRLVRDGKGQRPPPDHRRVRVGRRRVDMTVPA